MGKVLGIVNRKGGVGKTTTATTLSYLLSKEGCKVALIDFDGQRHTTKLCGVTAPEQLSVTIYDILKCIVMNEELPDKGSYMIRTETGVDLIPANNKLDNFDKLMCDTDFAEYKLKEFVDTIKEQYDYILIDGMPKMGTAMINVMICCDSLIIPVQSETLAVEGMAEFLRAFHRIKTVGISNPHMSNIDRGKTKVSLATLIDIANALDMTLDALICDNLVKGKVVFDEEISQELEECSEEDIRIVYDMVKALVKSLAKRKH